MPRYFFSSIYDTIDTVQLNDDIPDEYCNNACTTTCYSNALVTVRDPSTSSFMNTLVNKLYDMALALKNQFSMLETMATHVSSRGVVFAAIDAPPLVFQVNYEYVLYIQRYGPPLDGVFNQSYLADLRKEMATV